MEQKSRNLEGLSADHRARLEQARAFLNSQDGQKTNSNGNVNTSHVVTHFHPLEKPAQRRMEGYPSVDSTTSK